MFKIIALGSNGFIPTFNRHTISYMLVDDSDEVIVLDAGTGMSRFLEPQVLEIMKSKNRLNIILSHFHLDHTIGLSYLPTLWPVKPIRVFAPSKPYIDFDAGDALNKLLNPPLFSLPFENYPNKKDLIPVCEPELRINGYLFQFIKLNHPGGSMGIRIEDDICYITDTFVNEEYVDFVSGCEYLLHEIWMTRAEAKNSAKGASGHSILEDVIDLSVRAKVKNMIPIHLQPKWSEEVFLNNLRISQNGDVNIVPLTDGMTTTE
jgi:ribonuclease BN (tRNA processing enzyme)